jgi:hypothetical protein
VPLIGIVDPSHAGIKNRRAGKLPPWYTLDEVLEKSAAAGPKWSPWPTELIAAAIGEHQERGDRLSTSLLTGGCPRGSVLERKVDWVGDLDTMYASLRGTLLHKVFEDYARPGSVAEVRFYTTVDDIEFSCSPDLLTPDTLIDWKMTENPPTFGYPYRSHTEQVMFNAYVARHAERWEKADGSEVVLPFDPRIETVKAVVVVYVGPKGPKPIVYEKAEKFITPADVEKERKRPYVWSDKEVLAELRPRLHTMAEALEFFPAWNSPYEMTWGGGPRWTCPGPPLCHLPNCLAKRDPAFYTWKKEGA